MRVSLIATVYNEGPEIRRLLDSVLAQTRQPDEIVICDGGSQDETVPILQSYAARLPNLRILSAPGANISRGRNVAIQAAAGPLIAATDAGVRLDRHWLARLIAPFESSTDATDATDPPEDVQAVAGFFLPDASGPFPVAMAATVLPLPADIDPARFLPSSRSVAFRKSLWQRVGGYPEWLDYCEDLIFDLRVRRAAPPGQQPFVWAPDALVYFRPRTSLAGFGQQYFRYARGDGKADLWRRRHAIRYATYLLLLPALLGHAVAGRFARWLGWLGLLAGAIAYCARPWQRLWQLRRGLSAGQLLWAALLVPLIRLVGDGAKMLGYPVGLAWRWQRRNRAEIHWQQLPQQGERQTGEACATAD